MTSKPSSLQAVLERTKTETAATPPKETQAHPRKPAPRTSSREGTVLVGGHFPPDVSRQLSILAAEEGVTKQELLAQALDLLFVKKGKQRMNDV